MTGKQEDGDNGQFLRAMFKDLNDLSEGTDEEVTEELLKMGVNPEEAKQRLLDLIKKQKKESKNG